MNKKILYAILVVIIVIGAIIIGTMGLKADIVYSKNIKIDVYLGKEYKTEDINQIVKEIFGDSRFFISQVEYYNDMFSLTISQETENVDEKVEKLNTKINEKYELENKKDDIQVTYMPKIKLSSLVKPYIAPIAISMVLTLIYVAIRYKKLGIFKTALFYILAMFAVEAVYLSILAICRISINRLVIPIALIIYVLTITVLTIIKEKELKTLKVAEEKKNK